MKVIDVKQGTHEWHEARRGTPTASCFRKIVTAKQWGYAAGAKTYVQELIAEAYSPSYGMHDEHASRAMLAGIEREPEARRFYTFVNSCEVQEVGFCKTDDDRFGCSPDGLIGDDGAIEIKSPTHKTQVKWLLEGGVPPEHLAQCHGVLLVTGRPWIDFLSYCPPLPNLLVRVEPDEKTEKLRGYLDQFWDELQSSLARVKSLHEPEPKKVLDFGSLGTLEVGVHQESYF